LFRVVIVEDEKPILELMKVVVGRNPHCQIVGAFSNPLEALASLPGLKPDITFLDVEMPRLSGLELAHRMNEIGEESRIVFTTAYREYALEAFNVFAFDYILKPVTPAAIDRITSRLLKEAGRSAPPPASIAAPQASIRCFGSFEVRNPKGELVHWPTRKTEELLAYLLCYPNQECSKWQLMDALWPEMDEERAVHNLHNTVYRLKKLMKEQEMGMDVGKTRDGYLLETLTASYDLLELRQWAAAPDADASADAAQRERLCGLYRGVLLSGKDYMWKLQLEEGYGKQYMNLVHDLASRYVGQEEWAKAEQRLTDCLSLYPLEESIHLLLMEVYAASGRRERIVKHYAGFEEQYRRELGIAPPPDMKSRLAAYVQERTGDRP
jgi:two-component system, LytTR family, response regulator